MLENQAEISKVPSNPPTTREKRFLRTIGTIMFYGGGAGLVGSYIVGFVAFRDGDILLSALSIMFGPSISAGLSIAGAHLTETLARNRNRQPN